jgi:uncharacterized protein YecT (DUF1311 family)
MIRTLLAAAALALLAAPAAAAKPPPSILDEVDHCPGESNMELLQCAGGISAREDARLNRAYKAALKRLPPSRQQALRMAQRRRIKDRDAACEPEFDGGGAQAGIYGTACIARLTHDRALELERTGP